MSVKRFFAIGAEAKPDRHVGPLAFALKRNVIIAIPLFGLLIWALFGLFEPLPFGTGNPARDARTALSHGDHRLLAVSYGWGSWVPVLPNGRSASDSIVQAHGFRMIVWMSDVVYPDERGLRRKSLVYAENYNAVVLAADVSR